jgi:hypothetical protein
MSKCNCPNCRTRRQAEKMTQVGVIARAKVAGEGALLALKSVSDSLYEDKMAGMSITNRTFTMLAAAALLHAATDEMAQEVGRKADIDAMMLGIRLYTAMFDFAVDFGSIDEEEPDQEVSETQH